MASATEAVVLGTRAESSDSRHLRRILGIVRRQPLGVFGAIVCVAFVVVAFAAPLITPHDPHIFVGPRLGRPSYAFPFGTNNLGQDVLARTIYGAQVSLVVGVASVLLGTVVGSALGLVAAYCGGWVDSAVQRALEVVASFPGLMLILVVVAALSRPRVARDVNLLTLTWELRVVVIAVGIGFIFATTRIVRSVALTERHAPYVEAAIACGAGWARIMWRHLLPNVMAYIIVGVSVTLGLAILAEASLSFLGYGVPPGTPAWGTDLSGINRQFFLQAPWLVLAPGGAISLTLLGFNFLGDALRDELDPRLRGR